MGLSSAAQFLGVPRSRIKLADLPRPDGHASGVAWWLPESLVFTRRRLTRARHWTTEEISDRLNVSVEELAAIPGMPAPVTAAPFRWEAREVRSWWRAWVRSLNENPDVLFSVDLPTLTGLSYDTVRTYNSKGRLPAPDGRLRGRPWWRTSTVSQWLEYRDRRRGAGH